MDLNETYFHVEMSDEAFISVNVPVFLTCFPLNIFFVFSLIRPQQGAEQVKQPLKTLLGSLIGCDISVHICALVLFFKIPLCKVFEIFERLGIRYTSTIMIYSMMISVNSSHWLNVFYCFQIIPVQRPDFVWFKRNIKVFIYWALFIGIAFCLLGISVDVAANVYLAAHVYMFNENYSTALDVLSSIVQVTLFTRLSCVLLSLIVMLLSSCVTVVFLWRHVKNMEKSSAISSSPRCQRHIKVTIISISAQALLHFIYTAFVLIREIRPYISSLTFDFENNMICTVISFYSFGTAINLGLSQSVFRQRAAHVWQKCFRLRSSLSV